MQPFDSPNIQQNTEAMAKSNESTDQIREREREMEERRAYNFVCTLIFSVAIRSTMRFFVCECAHSHRHHTYSHHPMWCVCFFSPRSFSHHIGDIFSPLAFVAIAHNMVLLYLLIMCLLFYLRILMNAFHMFFVSSFVRFFFSFYRPLCIHSRNHFCVFFSSALLSRSRSARQLTQWPSFWPIERKQIIQKVNNWARKITNGIQWQCPSSPMRRTSSELTHFIRTYWISVDRPVTVVLLRSKFHSLFNK